MNEAWHGEQRRAFPDPEEDGAAVFVFWDIIRESLIKDTPVGMSDAPFLLLEKTFQIMNKIPGSARLCR